MGTSRHALLVSGAVVLTATYAVGAATTTPFTTAADVVTAIPIAALGLAAVARWPLRPSPFERAVEPRSSSRTPPYLAWAVLLVGVIAWELVEYLAPGSRSAHPTLSSMADAVDRHRGLKAVLFFAWLWLVVLVVRAGSVRGR